MLVYLNHACCPHHVLDLPDDACCVPGPGDQVTATVVQGQARHDVCNKMSNIGVL